MKHNEILDEIYRVREKIAAEAGEDSQQLLAWVRAEEAKARARGVKFAPLPEPAEPSAIVREDPPKKQAFSFQKHGSAGFLAKES